MTTEFELVLEKQNLLTEILRLELLLFGTSSDVKKKPIEELRTIHEKLKDEYDNQL